MFLTNLRLTGPSVYARQTELSVHNDRGVPVHQSLSVELAALARELHSDLDVTQTLQAILHHAPTITGCDHASVILGDAQPYEVASATDRQAKRADLYQLEFGEGPSVTAMTARQPVVIEDIPAETRWRRWAPEAAQLGLQGAVSLRLGTHRATLGALSLYSSHPEWGHRDLLASAKLCARLASVAVASTQRISVLRRGVDDRTVISQAQGILQERHGIDTEKAFTVLLAFARSKRLEVSDAAEEVISGRDGPDIWQMENGR
jgi:transcriptional regulator with GAF, ATPase, and Fis domain